MVRVLDPNRLNLKACGNDDAILHAKNSHASHRGPPADLLLSSGADSCDWAIQGQRLGRLMRTA